MPYAKVLIQSKSPGIADGLTYEGDASTCTAGAIVSVPLRNKHTEGIVLRPQETKGDFNVKRIQKSLSEKPLLPDYCLRTAEWMSTYYMCSIRQAIQPFLPSKQWSDLLPVRQTFVRLLEENPRVRGPRQQDVVDYLRDEGWVLLSKLRDELQTPLSTLRTLEKQGVLTLTEQQVTPPPAQGYVSMPNLTTGQTAAYEQMRQTNKPTLLFGVTGSGKTELYAQCIGEAVKQGQQAILLVPEILLTEHIVTRFHTVLAPERVAVVHSRLTPLERKDIWRQCRAGSIDLVIGSRSALFSPLEQLGVVIMDEEHEWTYKNEQTPRYHARETAEMLCAFAGAKLVLGSATPSLEAWHKAQHGQYELVRLAERYQNAAMPDVSVVDLAEVYFKDNYPLSPTLERMIEETLQAGEQSVLFLNRRGYSSALLCLDCRRRLVSHHTQLPFSVHRRPDGSQRLIDHTTNFQIDAPTACPHCGSVQLIAIGAGTQKVEHLLQQRFPQARLLRADSDTMQHPEQMRTLLQTMRNREADILLGTQTVAKGLDLPNVTLAAVLVADVGMSLPHFRAGERVFHMLTQLTGRSGRSKPGRVVVQTFRPDCPEVQLAAQHETELYLQRELALRETLGYPPAVRMVRLLFRGPGASNTAANIQRQLKKIDDSHKIHCAPTLFGGGKVWQVLIRGRNPKALLAHISLDGCSVDVDPMECI